MLKLSRLPSGQPEIFASLQGEGVSFGTPSVFVRLALCNLRCTWCDTAYTWDWEHHDPKQEIMRLGLPAILDSVQQLGSKNVVITGGEPLLQQDLLAELTGQLIANGHRIEVETNGTILPTPALVTAVAQWNVSPKLASSGNPAAKREVDDALAWFGRQDNAFFKFVVVDPADLDEVCDLVRRYTIPPERVLLMPEGRDTSTLAFRSTWVAEACQQHGFRFTPRLHVLLWGDTRGR